MTNWVLKIPDRGVITPQLGSLAARSDIEGIQFTNFVSGSASVAGQFPSGGSGGCNPPNSLIWLVDQPATLANRLFSIPDRSTMLTHSLAMLNWLTMLAESQIPDLNWKPSVYKTDALPIVLIWRNWAVWHLVA